MSSRVCEPGLPCPPRSPARCVEEHGCFSVEAACSDRKLRPANKGAAGGGGSATPRPLMNLSPLISGVAFEGQGQRGSSNVHASAVLGFYCFSQDSALTGASGWPRGWTDISSLLLERQFPFLLKLSVCLSHCLAVQHTSRLGWGSRIPLLILPRQRLVQAQEDGVHFAEGETGLSRERGGGRGMEGGRI